MHDRLVISRVPDRLSNSRRASIGLQASRATSGWFHPLNILLCVHLAFVLLFDYLGDAFRQDTSAILGLAYGLLALSAGLFKRHQERVLLVAAGAIAATWALSHLLLDGSFNRDLVSFSSAARSLFPFVAGVAIISWRDRLSMSTLKWVVIVVCGAAVANATLQPPVTLAGTERLHPFSAGLHTSAYLVSFAVVVVIELYFARLMKRAMAAILVVVSVALLTGYGVRTPIVFLLVYFTVRVAVRWRAAIAVELRIPAGVAVILAVGLLTAYVSGADYETIDEIASGRLSSYDERLSILTSRSVLEQIVGFGPGTDRLVTQTWWWEEKDSHSDFLQIFWEGGLLGVVATLAYVWGIARIQPRFVLPAVLALCASSLISNATLARPNVAFLFFCIVALKLTHDEAHLLRARSQRHPSGVFNGVTPLARTRPLC